MRRTSRSRFTHLFLQALEDRAVPATFTVNSTSDAVLGDGNLTLREAIASCNLGNNSGLTAAEKLLVSGAYGSSDTISLTGISGTITLGGTELPALAKTLSIIGPGAGTLSISGDNKSRIFNISGATATTFSGLTLTKGSASGNGGAIFAPTGATVTVQTSVLTGNFASQYGGAIGCYGTLVVTDSTISANSSGSNIAGIFGNASLTLTRSTLSGNSTPENQAGLFTLGTLLIDSSTITGNSAGLSQGGLGIHGGAFTRTIRNSTIANNKANGGSGGGIYFGGSGSLNVQNCTISGNFSAGNGGGILATGGLLNFDSTIVSGNAGAVTGPDIFNSGTVNVNFSAIGSTAGFTLTGISNLIGQNLKLGPLTGNGGPTSTILPASDSPVRDAGSNFAALITDQRGSGFPRVWNGQADIGAIELNPQFIVRNTNDAGKDSLRQQVLDTNAFAGSDTITFDSSFNVSKSITLTTGELAISESVTFNGPGANLLTVSGNNVGRSFNFALGTTSAISGLTITGGKSVPVGGGIVNKGTLTVNNVRLTGNSAVSRGGAIDNYGGTLTVTNVTINGNSAPFGGGLSNYFGTATVDNTTIAGNTGGNGGGVENRKSLTIRNSTITGNSAPSGGGIYNRYSNTINVTSSIVSGNTASNGPDISSPVAAAVNFSAIGSTSGFTLTGSNNLTVGANLNLASLADNGGPVPTIAFDTASPLLNAGSNPGSLTTDARGFVRSDGLTDIGAIEMQAVVTNTANTGSGSLRQAMLDTNYFAGANTITFDPTVFNTPRLISLNGTLGFNGGITITGPGANLLTVNCTYAFRALNVSPGVVGVFSGMTLTNGFVVGAGGSVYGGTGSTVTLQNMILTNNQGTSGGAIFALGTLNITDSQITGNTATSNIGGIYALNLTMQRCTVSGNSAGNGIGGIFAQTNLLLEDSTVSTNSALFGGGVLLGNGAGPFTARNSTIANNKATGGSGAGLALAFSPGAPFNNTITVQNCTITGNSASTTGGGLAHRYGTGTIVIASTIVSGNSATASGADISSTAAVTLNDSAVGNGFGFAFSGANNLPFGTNLKLGALAMNGGATATCMPAADSPVIERGSNPFNLSSDQRGLPRGVGAYYDIGAVEVGQTSVVSITRTDTNPTSAASVSWAVTMANAVTGVSAANFTLSGPGATGAGITGVTGSGSTYTVTSTTAAEGSLALNFASTANLSLLPTNLPFAGQSYTVDKVALSATLTASVATVTDAAAGAGSFKISAVYTEAMDTASTPAVSFPVENPGVALSFQSGAWTNGTTYVATYNVADTGLTLPNIDVQISGGKDANGTTAGTFTKANAFAIDTQNPVILSIARDNPLNNKLASVSWTVTYSEPVTAVPSGTFTLLNGGLTGSPAVTGVSGSGTTYTVTASTGGSGAGSLALTALSSGNAIDANGNPVGALPVTGGAYNIDFVSPAASSLNVSTLIVSDANVGPDGFSVTAKFNELMNQGVQPGFAFLDPVPAGSITFSSGTWLDAVTWQAKFTVADLGTTLNDIDVQITGAQDLAGNVQTPINAADLVDLDTQNAMITSITSASPNGTYIAGQSVDITLNFNEPVNLVGILNVTLDTGAVVSIAGPQSGDTLSGSYTVGGNQTSNDLNVTAIALTGGSTLKDDATNNSVLTLPPSNLANNAAIVIGAGVTSIEVNTGAAQRSRLTSIKVNFISAIQVTALEGFGLTRTAATATGTVGTVVNTSSGLIVTPPTGLASSITLTFDNIQTAGVEFGSLADGRWRLAIPQLNYLSPLDDIDLRRLFGDINNDGTVNGATDFAQFGNVFGVTLPDSPFDFNNDGTINGTNDFAAFGGRFGVTL